MCRLSNDHTLSRNPVAVLTLAKKPKKLQAASKLEIVSLMDNTVDFLSSNTRKEVQSFWRWVHAPSELPFAEHGFSMLIRVFDGKKSGTILFDTGVSPNGVIINAKRMGINLNDVSYIVLSHGHYDHFGGLSEIVKTINKIDLPIIAHENMVMRRGNVTSKGEIREYPTFPKSDEILPAKIIDIKKPLLINSNLALVTGEIPRTLSFEKGLNKNRIYKNNVWQPDPLVLDDRAFVINVKDKGLVIISGCAHAGIINTVKYAQKITGISKVYAILGGFHLSGKEFERRIMPTIEELKKINPELIIPSHCTGWRALFSLAQAFPNAFVHNSVGNIYQFE